MVWSLGIHEAARWQFCKKSHRPFRICALAINSSALGPWPRPREIMSKCSVLPRSSLAKRNNWAAGSEPTTDWKGVQNGYNIDEKWQKNYFLSEFSCKKAGRMRSVHLLLNNMTDNWNFKRWHLTELIQVKVISTNLIAQICLHLPDDRINISGVLAVDSSYISFRLMSPLDTNFSPISCSMNARTEAIRASGFRILMRIILWKGVRHSHGITMNSPPFGFVSVKKVMVNNNALHCRNNYLFINVLYWHIASDPHGKLRSSLS